MDTMKAAELQQGGALLPVSVGKQLSTKVPSSRGARGQAAGITEPGEAAQH